MGRTTSGHMFEARHGVMLLGEEFGVHLPRALTAFITSIGPVGAAFEAAFPFLAVIVGATLLIEHLAKIRAAGIQLTEDQEKFATAAQNAFNKLEDKILQAEIRADELRNDHLGALRLQLELIDHQSMDELVHSFEEVAKAAETVMKELEGHWYTFGIGSDGASAALKQFQTKYEHLLSLRTDAGREEAHNLLTGTLKTAEDVLQAQRTIQANRDSGEGMTDDRFQAERTLEIHKASLTVTKSEVAAQEAIVDALRTQANIEADTNKLKELNSGNATKSTGKEGASLRAAAQREEAESMSRLGEQQIAGDRAVSQAQLAIHRASIQERLAVDVDFAGRERDLHLATNQAEIAALDKSDKDYNNQLKARQDKSLEIIQQYETKVTELKSKALIESAAKELRDMEQAEREKIEATVRGSKAHLAALDAAIKEEESKNLQDTAHYRELLNQRVNLIKEMAEEERKLKAEAGIEEAQHEQKMGELILAAQRQHQALLNSAHSVSAAQRVAQEIKFANDEYAIKLKEFKQEEAALDKFGKDYNNKLKAIRDKEKQLEQQNANDTAAIREKAEKETNDRVLAAARKFNDQMTAGLSQVLMGHQSFAKMMNTIGDQLVSTAIQNAIKMIEANMMGKESDAAKAARAAFNIGINMGPAGIVLGPLFGALAFATVSAYAGGTDRVPGIGTGDTVPAMLTPGEGVVPGGVMDGLSNLAKSGGLSGGTSVTHVHVRPTYHVQTIDGNGMQAALEKHTDVLQRHFEGVVRKMNR